MTIDLKSRPSQKLRAGPNTRKLELEIDDFINSFPEYRIFKMTNNINENPIPLDTEFEVSGTPNAKRIRIVTFNVENRKKAKFESVPLDFYADI
jgi:hypothetical protein